MCRQFDPFYTAIVGLARGGDDRLSFVSFPSGAAHAEPTSPSAQSS